MGPSGGGEAAGSAAANLILEPGAEGSYKDFSIGVVKMVTWNCTAWVVLTPTWQWDSTILFLEKSSIDYRFLKIGEKLHGFFGGQGIGSFEQALGLATFQLLRHRSILESDYGRGCGLSEGLGCP